MRIEMLMLWIWNIRFLLFIVDFYNPMPTPYSHSVNLYSHWAYAGFAGQASKVTLRDFGMEE